MVVVLCHAVGAGTHFISHNKIMLDALEPVALLCPVLRVVDLHIQHMNICVACGARAREEEREDDTKIWQCLRNYYPPLPTRVVCPGKIHFFK